MAASSLRPMCRFRISSAAWCVSKLHPSSDFTSGIGIGHSSRPTVKIARVLFSLRTTLLASAYALRNCLRHCAFAAASPESNNFSPSAPKSFCNPDGSFDLMASTKACIPSSGEENVVCPKNLLKAVHDEAVHSIANNRTARTANGHRPKCTEGRISPAAVASAAPAAVTAAPAAMTSTPAARAATTTVKTGVAACSKVVRRSSVANAFEGMRSQFTAAKPGWSGPRGTAARKVAAIPRKSRGGIVPAEILPDRRRGRRAPILLTQRSPLVWDASAVDRIVCPSSRDGIVIVVIVDGHHVDLSMRPVEGAEEETGSHPDTGAPDIADAQPWTHEVPGPRSPEHRRIGRPPPGAIDDRGIVVGNVHHLRIRRGNRNVLTLLVNTSLVGRLEGAVG